MAETDFDKIPADKRSNLDWAAQVASEVDEHWDDPLFRNALTLALGMHAEDIACTHRAELQNLLNVQGLKHVNKVKRAVMKAFLKTNVLEIAKDADGGKKLHGGEFKTGGGRLSAGYGRNNAVPHDAEGPDGPEHSAAAQAQMASMAVNMVNAAADRFNGGRRQSVVFTTESKRTGEVHHYLSHDGSIPQFPRSERITSLRYATPDVTPLSVGGSTVEVMNALGMDPNRTAYAGGGVQAFADQYRDSVAGTQWGDRLIHLTDTLHGVSGSSDPRINTAALLARAVGNNGPEAAKVLAPHVRRFAYRYKGQELNNTQVDRLFNKPGEKGPAFPMVPQYEAADRNTKRSDVEAGHEFTIANQLASHIPSDQQIEALLATGSTPPSTGVIINKNHRVTNVAMSQADDHYVPFNLSHIHNLDGGSYIRTRAFGGPTTEDLSTALMTGADHIQVVSKNGIFRVDFDPNHARFGPTQRAAVQRYGRLLDAVKHGKVKVPGASGESGSLGASKLDGPGYAVALNALKTQFPTLITNVKYTSANDLKGVNWSGDNSSKKEDTGYIRPYFLKPGQAHYGYYSTKLGGNNSYDDIEGYKYGQARKAAVLKKYVNEVAPVTSWGPKSPAATSASADTSRENASTGTVVLRSGTPEEKARAAAGGGVAQNSARVVAGQHIDMDLADKIKHVFNDHIELANGEGMDPGDELNTVHSFMFGTHPDLVGYSGPEMEAHENRIVKAIAQDNAIPAKYMPEGADGIGLRSYLIGNGGALNELHDRMVDASGVDPDHRLLDTPSKLLYYQAGTHPGEPQRSSATPLAAILTVDQVRAKYPDMTPERVKNWTNNYGSLNQKNKDRLIAFRHESSLAEAADMQAKTGERVDSPQEAQEKLQYSNRNQETRGITRSEVEAASAPLKAGPVEVGIPNEKAVAEITHPGNGDMREFERALQSSDPTVHYAAVRQMPDVVQSIAERHNISDEDAGASLKYGLRSLRKQREAREKNGG